MPSVRSIRTGIDPAGILPYQRTFVRDITSRYSLLSQYAVRAITVRDVFGLVPVKVFAVDDMLLPGHRLYEPYADDDKIDAFLEWVEEMEALKGIELTGNKGQWVEAHIRSAYNKGVRLARLDIKSLGRNVPSTNPLSSATADSVHLERAATIFTNTWNNIKSLTEEANARISRILAKGLLENKSPKQIAEWVRFALTYMKNNPMANLPWTGQSIRQRAELIALTEVSRAHHYAMVQEYRNAGIENVMFRVETMHDSKVCSKCSSLEGIKFTLNEAEGLVPVHPRCRCRMYPVVISEQSGS